MENSLSGMAGGYAGAVSSGRTAGGTKQATLGTKNSYYTANGALNENAIWDDAYAFYLEHYYEYNKPGFGQAGKAAIDKTIASTDYAKNAARGSEDGNRIIQYYIEYLNSVIDAADTEEQKAQEIQEDYISTLIDYYEAKKKDNPDYIWDDLTAAAALWFSEEENGGNLAAEAVAAARSQYEAGQAAKDSSNAASIVGAQLDDITSRVEALTAAYNEAYDAAYKSMSGQFKLFEKAGDASQKSEMSVGEMVGNLESQAEYMRQYQENLKKLKELELDEGLIAQLSDGSAESAAYVATLAGADKDQIAELNEAYAGVEQARQDYAATVASIETDFDATMASIQADLVEIIGQMDKSGEAAAAAQATINAYSAAAASDENLQMVKDAYLGLAAAAEEALKNAMPDIPTEGAAEAAADTETIIDTVEETAAAAEPTIEVTLETDKTGEELASETGTAAQNEADKHKLVYHAEVELDTSVIGTFPDPMGAFRDYTRKGYARGGRASMPSIFGEAGPEWAIPEEHSARTAALIDAVRRAAGFSWADLVGNAARQPAGTSLVSNSYARTYTANANLNVGAINMGQQMDAEALFDTMAARNRATVRGYGS